MKTTPTLGLKLYDGTDAPDLVSGYNASMSAIDGSGVLAFQGRLQDSTDWDTIVDAGYYDCANTQFSSANHSPVGSYRFGVLVVYKRCNPSTCVTQIYYPHAGDAANRAPVSRVYYANAWSAWAPLVYVPEVPDNVLTMPSNGSVLKNGDAVYSMTIGPSGGGVGSSSWTITYLRFNAYGHTPTFTVGPNGGVLEDIYSINGVQLATAAITSEEEMKEFLVEATKDGAWVGSGTVTHGELYGGAPAPCVCDAFRQNGTDAPNLVITGSAPEGLGISTFQIVALGDGVSQDFTLRGIILTYNEDGGAPTQTLIGKFSDLRSINLKLSRMVNS